MRRRAPSRPTVWVASGSIVGARRDWNLLTVLHVPRRPDRARGRGLRLRYEVTGWVVVTVTSSQAVSPATTSGVERTVIVTGPSVTLASTDTCGTDASAVSSATTRGRRRRRWRTPGHGDGTQRQGCDGPPVSGSLRDADLGSVIRPRNRIAPGRHVAQGEDERAVGAHRDGVGRRPRSRAMATAVAAAASVPFSSTSMLAWWITASIWRAALLRDRREIGTVGPEGESASRARTEHRAELHLRSPMPNRGRPRVDPAASRPRGDQRRGGPRRRGLERGEIVGDDDQHRELVPPTYGISTACQPSPDA